MAGTKRTSMAAAIAIVVLMGCGDTEVIQQPPLGTGSADFTRFVAIGNSMTAGVQGFGVEEKHQRLAFPAQIAAQVGKTVYTRNVVEAAPAQFVIPGYSAPGTPGTLKLIRLVPPEIEPTPPEQAGHPVNLNYPAPYNSLAVPGARAHHLATLDPQGPDPDDPISLENRFFLVLRGSGTVLEQAAALNPTFVALWIGGSDVLGGVVTGDPADMTPVDVFETAFTGIVETLDGLPSNPGIVCADIPSPLAVPFATTVPPYLVNPASREPIRNPVTGELIPLLGPAGPLSTGADGGPADRVTLAAVDLIMQGYGLPVGFSIDIDLDGEADIEGQGPLPGAVVISVEEQALIRERVDDLNRVIGAVCADHGIPLVPVSRLLQDAIEHGIHLGGLEYRDTFITGGLFSIDGIHPTDMGQAVIANAFLTTINEAFGASIPLVNYADLMGLSFGVDPVENIRLDATVNPWEVPASFYRALREHPFVQGFRRPAS